MPPSLKSLRQWAITYVWTSSHDRPVKHQWSRDCVAICGDEPYSWWQSNTEPMQALVELPSAYCDGMTLAKTGADAIARKWKIGRKPLICFNDWYGSPATGFVKYKQSEFSVEFVFSDCLIIRTFVRYLPSPKKMLSDCTNYSQCLNYCTTNPHTMPSLCQHFELPVQTLQIIYTQSRWKHGMWILV